MWLYLVRHADAVPRADWTGDDATRPLTEEGEAEARAAALGLARLDLKVDVILTSPRQRAEQTAHLIAEALGGTVRTDDLLADGFDIPALASMLSAYSTASGVMLVGHEPDLSTLAGHLCGPGHTSAHLHMRKGACCAIKLPRHRAEAPGKHGNELDGGASLEWLLTTRQLALIGTAPPPAQETSAPESASNGEMSDNAEPTAAKRRGDQQKHANGHGRAAASDTAREQEHAREPGSENGRTHSSKTNKAASLKRSSSQASVSSSVSSASPASAHAKRSPQMRHLHNGNGGAPNT